MRVIPSIIFTLLFTTTLSSQKIDHSPHFHHLLNKIEAEYFEPLDAGYKDYRPLKNEYLNSHFSIKSNQEKMEIRYFIIPWNDDDPNTSTPNIQTFTAMTNIAVNTKEAIISAIQPTKESLSTDYNADWGMTYFFKPKPVFSNREHCRMIALCKEGKGTIFIFYLFDDAGNEALDRRSKGVRFL